MLYYPGNTGDPNQPPPPSGDVLMPRGPARPGPFGTTVAGGMPPIGMPPMNTAMAGPMPATLNPAQAIGSGQPAPGATMLPTNQYDTNGDGTVNIFDYKGTQNNPAMQQGIKNTILGNPPGAMPPPPAMPQRGPFTGPGGIRGAGPGPMNYSGMMRSQANALRGRGRGFGGRLFGSR